MWSRPKVRPQPMSKHISYYINTVNKCRECLRYLDTIITDVIRTLWLNHILLCVYNNNDDCVIKDNIIMLFLHTLTLSTLSLSSHNKKKECFFRVCFENFSKKIISSFTENNEFNPLPRGAKSHIGAYGKMHVTFREIGVYAK
jgi:hypothetical protein